MTVIRTKIRIGLATNIMQTGSCWKQLSAREKENKGVKMRIIEIIEGHNSSSYFWIQPIKKYSANWKELQYLGKEEISIEEGDVDCFL